MVRMQATQAADVWSSYCSLATSGTISAALPSHNTSHSGQLVATPDEPHQQSRGLRSLTLELTEACLSIRLLQSGLLLCLMGPIFATAAPSSSSATPNSNPSSPPSQRPSLPSSMPTNLDTMSPASAMLSQTHTSHCSSEEQAPVGTVALIRAQAERLARFLDEELGTFRMPEGTGDKG